MPEPRQKDWLDVCIDFFFGAAFADFWIIVCEVRGAGRAFSYHGQLPAFGIILLGAGLIAGSVAALYRNEFWAGVETYKAIPPMEERVAKWNKVILWTLFALGWACLGLLFFW